MDESTQHASQRNPAVKVTGGTTAPVDVQRHNIRIVEAEELINDLNTRKSIAGVRDFGVVPRDFYDATSGETIKVDHVRRKVDYKSNNMLQNYQLSSPDRQMHLVQNKLLKLQDTSNEIDYEDFRSTGSRVAMHQGIVHGSNTLSTTMHFTPGAQDEHVR